MSVLSPMAIARQGPAGQPAAGALQVEYLVSIPEPQTQTLTVAMTLRGLSEPSIEVCLPVWRPGKYAVLDQAGSIRSISAKSGSGKPMAVVKIEKSAWIVNTGVPQGDRTVTVEYTLYANSLGDRTRHVDETHAFISPAAVMMYSPPMRDKPVRVKLDVPKAWHVATGLETEGKDERTLLAADYDVLVDSPIEAGLQEKTAFDVDGTPHEIVFWTAGAPMPELDRGKLTKDLTSIIRRQRDMFGGFPYKRYVFLVHCYPGGSGGTEHLNSTVMQCGPTRFSTPEGMRSFCGLASHEYFHTYNVKQLRPAGLKPYDYMHENYTELLWVAEGITSYYDDLTLARVGIKKPDQYLKTVGDGIDAYRRRPGALVQSVEDSSFDAWIKFNKASPDGVNSTVSFYDKGAMAGMMLDFELRRVSGNKVTLDHVMADMYKAFPLDGPGYTTEDMIKTCERLAAGNFRGFFDAVVKGTGPLDFEGALALAGLEVVMDAKKDGEVLKQRPFIGLNVEAKDGAAVVTAALSDGPAYKAGVIAGDAIVAFNGQRVRGDFDALVKLIKPGDSVRLTLFRYDHLKEVEFKADGRADGKWVVRRMKAATPEQIAVYESWMEAKWPAKGAKDDADDKDGKDGKDKE